ncbi:MAG: HAMP domain-containing protein [Myxococcales bacterium]|nr:HAMP domain-containing protein [Myxococcales bacterium]
MTALRGLFLRIFLWFWVALTLVGAASAIVYGVSEPDERWRRQRSLFDETLLGHAEAALEVLAHEGEERANQRLRALYERSDVAIFIERDDRVLLGALSPERIVERAIAEAQREERYELRIGSRVAVVLPLENGDRVIAARSRRTIVERFFGSRSTLPVRLAIMLLIGGVVAFGLARYLSRPLRQFRGAAQRIAAGDLDVRVTPALRGATEEVVEVAHDFDRMAERIAQLLEAQQRLLRDVSHELRSPLARLRVALELARDAKGPDHAAPHLDRIELETERLSDLIGQILTLTRLEAEGPVREELELGALVAELVQDADYEARGSAREVALESEGRWQIPGRSDVLRWAIENVLRNAVRFTPEGTKVQVTIREGRDAVEVAVRDHGPGVPEDELEAIFRPFYRVSTARDRKSGGSGVGLAIASSAAQVHGGSISARNHPDGGLVVTLRLPKRREPTGRTGRRAAVV